MKLRCNSNYRTQAVVYTAGQVIDVNTQAQVDFLLRDSPGTFSPVSEATNDPVTETATGVAAPDRRARGGKKRGSS